MATFRVKKNFRGLSPGPYVENQLTPSISAEPRAHGRHWRGAYKPPETKESLWLR
ncbi:hypothetical protein SAMN04488503_0659 [Humidesulfovibrio mexicanus]|uniref:Uncharacterized protein n=1 Tax=Humidesulfovibrio mexicanus TaxID=147047 RepID=A0A238Y4M2_9BACT|nr:hypothetical protein SAMN04488503_0659 [Humidesulfovibrio mexicanus]